MGYIEAGSQSGYKVLGPVLREVFWHLPFLVFLERFVGFLFFALLKVGKIRPLKTVLVFLLCMV